jgi:hypothetical protein
MPLSLFFFLLNRMPLSRTKTIQVQPEFKLAVQEEISIFKVSRILTSAELKYQFI